MACLTSNDVGECGCGPCRICVLAYDCDTGLPVSGASVAVSGVGTCSTDASGRCCLEVADSGTYTVTVSGGGYKPFSQAVSVTCPQVLSMLVVLGNGFTASASGCNGLPLAGATITIGPATVTTGADGTAPVTSLGPGTYPWTVSAPRMVSRSGTLTVSGTSCQEVTWIFGTGRTFFVGLSPAAGFACVAACAYPLKTTLHATHSALGNATLVYDGAAWRGTWSNPPPGGCGCDPGDWNGEATFDGATLDSPQALCVAFPLSDCPWQDLPGCNHPPVNFIGYTQTGRVTSCPPSFLWTADPVTTRECGFLTLDANFFGPGVTLTGQVTE